MEIQAQESLKDFSFFRPLGQGFSAYISRLFSFDMEWLCLIHDFSFYHGRILIRLHFLEIVAERLKSARSANYSLPYGQKKDLKKGGTISRL